MTARTKTILAAALAGAGLLTAWLVQRSVVTTGSNPLVPALSADVKSLTVRHDGDHAQLSLTAIFQQDGTSPIRLEPPLITLHGADGKPLPRFIGPMLQDPVLPGAAPLEITLHYWLPTAALKTSPVLETAGTSHRLTIPGT